MTQDAAREPQWLPGDPEQVQELLRQDSLLHGGLGLLASTLVALVVQSAGWWRVRRDQAPTPR